MHKITKDSCKAFIEGFEFKRDNTVVRVNGGRSKMYLHGHRIAEFNLDNKELIIRNCGYTTVTTKRRLRGILNFASKKYYELMEYIGLYQKDFVWYLDHPEKERKEFESGWNTIIERTDTNKEDGKMFDLAEQC